MSFNELRNRKEKLFEVIMECKYNGQEVPLNLLKEYRYLQREFVRRVRTFKNISYRNMNKCVL